MKATASVVFHDGNVHNGSAERKGRLEGVGTFRDYRYS
jgi:hypothetical protein